MGGFFNNRIMKRLSIEEVKERFKDVKVVAETKLNGDKNELDLTNYDLSLIKYNDFGNICIGNNYFYLYCSNSNSYKAGYAEIIEYKSNTKPKHYKTE